jgi:NAD(P)-dependent dehydrogenase (short-subunit alcohol dehydrogenase family)
MSTDTTVTARFAGRTAAVTGAASGIGRAIAHRLVAEGATVIAGDLNEVGLRSLRDELVREGRAPELLLTRACDVTNEDDVQSLVNSADTHLDLMFNVAGGTRGAPLIDLSASDWDFTVDLCLKGVFFGIKHAAQRMARSRGGRGGVIVNIASLNSRVPMFFGGAYSASKAGVVSLGQTAAIELADEGIRVATVSPGLTDTPLVAPLTDQESIREAYLERIPMRRAAQPSDIAAAALFLASNDAAYITGVNLFVDGGWEQTAYPDLRPFLAERS